MGLKQSIVVVSQFNVKGPGGAGSRGSTPGDYVKRYAARGEATEELAPVRLGAADDYIRRYMAREDATEEAGEGREPVFSLKRRYRRAQGLGGRAFGPEGPSLSHDELNAKSKAAQEAFEQGRTLIMPVLSFTEEYLRENGIIDDDFHCTKRGDYRGNVDQMKLRMAIAEGMARMGRGFDDMDWVGAVQVDTQHVHCHLLAWDRGQGRLMPNGQQRGKLSERDISQLRRGIDLQLEQTRSLQRLSANITDDRRNVRCFVKRYVNDIMLDAGVPQFLLACLPEDRRLWRMSTNRKEMRKPNEIVREFVESVLDRPGSGWTEARRQVAAYARFRAERESLTMREERLLVERGEERILEDCCNGVYDVMRSIPDSARNTRTPLLDIMSMEYAEAASLKSNDPMVEFGFRLRSYSSRLEHHRKEHRRYGDLVRAWDAAAESSEIGEGARAMRDFYAFEERYQGMLMAKYQHFLAFLPDEPDVDRQLGDLEDYGRRRDNLRSMIEDPALQRFSEAGAEEYGKRTYGQQGGALVLTNPDVMARRLAAMDAGYAERLAEMRRMLSDHARGVDEELEDDGEGGQRLRLRMRRHVAYVFDDVKALDMHHLAYDFPYDADVSRVNIEAFTEMAEERADKLDAAVQYLVSTGQGDYVSALPVADVSSMREMAQALSERASLPSKRVAAASRRPVKTTSLSDAFSVQMRAAVHATVASATSEYVE